MASNVDFCTVLFPAMILGRDNGTALSSYTSSNLNVSCSLEHHSCICGQGFRYQHHTKGEVWRVARNQLGHYAFLTLPPCTFAKSNHSIITPSQLFLGRVA